MFRKNDIRVVNPTEFPVSLQSLQDCPSVLYCIGNIDLLNSSCVSVAGSRKIDSSSGKWLENILSQCHATIVSGLALGTDTIAHETALDLDLPTIAVLPSGVKNIAPYSNRELARNIVDNDGLLISEYPPYHKPNRNSYINRNRIIAGLGKMLIVPQCNRRSGTMHTVRYANSYNKFIVIQDANYSGNRYIINNDGFKKLIK